MLGREPKGGWSTRFGRGMHGACFRVPVREQEPEENPPTGEGESEFELQALAQCGTEGVAANARLLSQTLHMALAGTAGPQLRLPSGELGLRRC